MRTSKAPSRPAERIAARQVESVLNALRRTVRAFRAAAMTAEKTLGVSGAQHFVLEKLADSPALSLNELAARTLTHKSSVSVVVSRLVHRGFVRRERSRSDRRGIVLTLTPAGRRALGSAPDSAQSRLLRALRRFPPDDLGTFSALFDRLTRELGVRELEPRMIFEDEPPRRRRAAPRRAARRAASSRRPR